MIEAENCFLLQILGFVPTRVLFTDGQRHRDQPAFGFCLSSSHGYSTLQHLKKKGKLCIKIAMYEPETSTVAKNYSPTDLWFIRNLGNNIRQSLF